MDVLHDKAQPPKRKSRVLTSDDEIDTDDVEVSQVVAPPKIEAVTPKLTPPISSSSKSTPPSSASQRGAVQSSVVRRRKIDYGSDGDDDDVRVVYSCDEKIRNSFVVSA